MQLLVKCFNGRLSVNADMEKITETYMHHLWHTVWKGKGHKGNSLMTEPLTQACMSYLFQWGIPSQTSLCCVQIPTYAEKVALPAFSQNRPILLPARPTAANLQQRVCCCGSCWEWTDKQTDTILFHRHCVGSANNSTKYWGRQLNWAGVNTDSSKSQQPGHWLTEDHTNGCHKYLSRKIRIRNCDGWQYQTDVWLI